MVRRRMRWPRPIAGALLALLCFSSQGAGQRPDVRFAWLSDTHVGSTTGAEDLAAAVGEINSSQDIQFVLLSGDITEFGSNEQLRLAKSILDTLRKPYHIIPGNHDTKWSESGGTAFPAIWGAERFVFDVGGYRFIGVHQGPRMKMADGHWAPEDLRWLDTVLTAMPHRQPFLIVTHYPVDSSIANWYELLARAKRYNLQAFLVGHGHGNRSENYEEVPAAMGRSLLRAADSTGGYTLGRISRDTLSLAERRTSRWSGPVWLRIGLGQRDYARNEQTWPRPDFSVNREYPDIDTLWSFRSGYLIASSAGVGEGIVVFGDASGRIYGLSAKDGSTVWIYSTLGPVYSSPAIAEGLVVFGSTDSSIHCLNVGDGSLRWRVRTGAPVVASPLVMKGVVYVGGSDRKFRAIHLRSGSLVWEYSGVDGFIECTPLVYEGAVYFGAWDETFYALDVQTGKLVWKWRSETPGILYSPAGCRPVGAGGQIFIVAPDRRMTAFGAATGAVHWRSGDHQVRESLGASADGKRIFIRTIKDSILALASSSPVPRTLWSVNAGFGYDINSAMPVEKEGVLFYGTKNGFLFALDSITGRLLWKHRVGVAAVHTVTPLDARRVVTTDFDGTVQLVMDQHVK